jgi:flagellin
MSFRVNTNVASQFSMDYLRGTSETQGKAVGRLTSGLRILASGDDAAGLAIANGSRSDQAMLTQGLRNANDGLSTLQTLDGGLRNINGLLDRARTLAAQSASGTFRGDRGVLQGEFAAVLGEIDRQAQAMGLSTGGKFARSFAVFVGGGRGLDRDAASSNGSVVLDLANAAVDTKSLGLNRVQAQGIGTVDIGPGSPGTSVQAILANSANRASNTVTGFTEFFFRGPGFAGGERIKVSVNLAGVTTVDQLVGNINAAITAAAQPTSQQATSFENAGIRAAVLTDSTGRKSLSFSSPSVAFQVTAGDRLANALLGNVTSSSNPTGRTLGNVFTTSGNIAAAGTTFGATGAGTVTFRFQGSSLASPVDVGIPVTATTTITEALASLRLAVAGNAALQGAGLTVLTTTAGTPMTFGNTRGERFEVLTSGDVNNLFALGSYQGSAGAGGSFDYATITGAAGTFAAAPETLEFSIGGGAKVAFSLTPAAAGIDGATTALNAAFASNSQTAAAGLVASNDGAAITITSTNGSRFRLNSVGTTNVFGFNDRGGAPANGVADVAEIPPAGTQNHAFAAGGLQQTGLLSFSPIRNGGDDQTITVTAIDPAGVDQSMALVLRNDTTGRNAGTVDEAVQAINNALQQSNNATLRQIIAIKDKATTAGPDGIRLISNLSSFNVSIGTNAGGTGIGGQGTIVTAALEGSSLPASVLTREGAEDALMALGEATTRVGAAQAVVGRGQNRFTYALNLAQSQLTNLAASESRIRDADMAEEAARLTKGQILLRSGVAALAQANSAPEQVLTLLRA